MRFKIFAFSTPVLVKLPANSYNLTVGGDFSYDDSASDFTWGDSDTLTVSGNVNIVAADFANSGAITITNSGNFTANTFANTGTVSAATVTIGVTNFANDIANTETVKCITFFPNKTMLASLLLKTPSTSILKAVVTISL